MALIAQLEITSVPITQAYEIKYKKCFNFLTLIIIISLPLAYIVSRVIFYLNLGYVSVKKHDRQPKMHYLSKIFYIILILT